MADVMSGGAGNLGVQVRVTGGRELQRWLARDRRPATLAAEAASAIRLWAMSDIRRDQPKRTGELRRSLRIRARVNRVQLTGASYAPFVRARRSGRTVAQAALPHMRRQAWRIAREFTSP